MIGRLFGRKKARPAVDVPLTYDQEKALASQPDAARRAELAAREDVRPEILYFLAEDRSHKVRREIARNTKTPRLADKILATDVDHDVRCELAVKIGRLIPGLSEIESSKLQELTFEVLRILAEDQLPRVRQIIAEEIKRAANVPAPIIQKLARDVEHIVSAPILEYSILLSDQDILEIVASNADSGVLSAISRRHNLSSVVCDVIVAARDEPSVAALLANTSAQIREETLDSIIDDARETKSWHEPLVRRPAMSQRAMRRIAGFVTSSLLSILTERGDLDPETSRTVAEAVKVRLKEEEGTDSEERRELDLAEAKRARKEYDAGKLDDEAITSAAEMGQRDFNVHALALKAKLPVAVVRRIMDSKTGRTITSLAWHANVGMRTAIALQKYHARIPSRSVLMARGGIDYPLSHEEMGWYVYYFED